MMKTENSINYLTGQEKEAIRFIKKEAIEFIQPLLIYCLESVLEQNIRRDIFNLKRKREDWKFSCTLLIITRDKISDDKINLLKQRISKYGVIKLICHHIEFMSSEMINGNLVLNWARTAGILLYDSENSLRKLPNPIKKTSENRAQADSYYNRNPNFENYLDEKIINEHRLVRKLDNEFRNIAKTRYPDINFQFISLQEISEPRKVIDEFFFNYDLTFCRSMLANWMNAVYKNSMLIKEEPGIIVSFAEMVLKLIEVSWLLNQTDYFVQHKNLSENLHCFKDLNFIKVWEEFPRSLSREEFDNPKEVIQNFFTFHNLSEWKYELKNLLHLALSKDKIEDTGQTVNTLIYKVMLEKLVEICHIIYRDCA